MDIFFGQQKIGRLRNRVALFAAHITDTRYRVTLFDRAIGKGFFDNAHGLFRPRLTGNLREKIVVDKSAEKSGGYKIFAACSDKSVCVCLYAVHESRCGLHMIVSGALKLNNPFAKITCVDGCGCAHLTNIDKLRLKSVLQFVVVNDDKLWNLQGLNGINYRSNRGSLIIDKNCCLVWFEIKIGIPFAHIDAE